MNSKAKTVMFAAALGGLALTACIAPPPKCTCDAKDGTASSNASNGSSSEPAEELMVDVAANPVIDKLVWDGASISTMGVDPPGSWYMFNDGSPTGNMIPPSVGEFEGSIENGAIHTKGSGYKTWGGGIGFQFSGGQMLTPADGHQYKGVSFKAWGTGWVHVALATVMTMPEFNVCKAPKCYDHHAVDIQVTSEPKTYTFTWDQLHQAGWGAPKGKLDTTKLIGLNFTSKGATNWDFYIDDVAFIE